MKEVIIEVIQPIVIEALRAMKKTSRSKIPEEAGVKQRKKSKISLMLDYIIEGAELATGNWQLILPQNNGHTKRLGYYNTRLGGVYGFREKKEL